MAKIPANVAIDVNDDNSRGKLISPSKASLRSTLVTSNAFSIPYHCYDTVKGKVVIFFIYSSGFCIGFYFGFTLLLLY